MTLQDILESLAAKNKEIATLQSELDKWRSYYGAYDPRDGVIGTAVGKIVGEQNREIAELRTALNEATRD